MVTRLLKRSAADRSDTDPESRRQRRRYLIPTPGSEEPLQVGHHAPSNEESSVVVATVGVKRSRARVGIGHTNSSKKARVAVRRKLEIEGVHQDLRTPEEAAKTFVAMQVVGRFMFKFAVSGQVTQIIARNTMAPSPTGASVGLSKMLGHTDYLQRARSHDTIRAMRRFVNYSGLFDKTVFASVHSWVFAANLLNCFDICGNPQEYKCFGVSDLPRMEMIRTATLLCTSLSHYRSLVVGRVYPWTATATTGTSAVQLQTERCSISVYCKLLYTQYTEFTEARCAWRRATAGSFKERVGLVLFNMYDSQEELRNGIKANTGGCVRKPYLQPELVRYTANAQALEQRFSSKVGTFDGVYLLKEIKDEYISSRGRSPEGDVTDRSLSVISIVPVTDVSVMHTVLQQLRSTCVYTAEMIHHESVVDHSFQLKWPRHLIDDACILKATAFTDVGCVEHMRQDMKYNRNTGPMYRYIQKLVRNLRAHLVFLGLHSKRKVVLRCLSDARWQSAIDLGTVEWGDVYNMLKTSVRAIYGSIGREEARHVLYMKRALERHNPTNATVQIHSGLMGRNVSPNSCSDTVRALARRPGLYEHLMAATASKARGNGGDKGFVVGTHGSYTTAFEVYGDSPRYGIGPTEYDDLVKHVVAIAHADEYYTPCELASLTIDTLLTINKTLSTLDVNLANAEIDVTRSYTHEHNIETEQASFDKWFALGLRTDNTLTWLRLEAYAGYGGGAADVHRMVFSGYVSLITGNGMLALEEEKYPELLLLDITYIQRARSVFYGHVIQAAVLVILAKRLTDMLVPARTTRDCINRLSTHDAFAALAKPDTCRASEDTITSLQAGVVEVLDCVMSAQLQHSSLSRGGLLWEIAREASHVGYPSSPVASHLAVKWATAMRMGVAIGTDGGGVAERDEASDTLTTAFKCPEATYGSFCSELRLPKAALCLSRELHVSVTGLVKRTWFNTAVHLRRYRKLLSQTERGCKS
jgi:hypothetical protein